MSLHSRPAQDKSVYCASDLFIMRAGLTILADLLVEFASITRLLYSHDQAGTLLARQPDGDNPVVRKDAGIRQRDPLQ